MAAKDAAIGRRNARRVWAAITRNPRASNRELAAQLNLGYSTVAKALNRLRSEGHIAFEHGDCRAVTIIIPFGSGRVVKRI